MLNKSVMEAFETANGEEVLGTTTREFLKTFIEAVLKYSTEICAMYNLPIGEVDTREALGKSRTAKHNVVIGNINMLRRACSKMGLEDPFDGKEFQERHDYAVAAFEILKWFLENN